MSVAEGGVGAQAGFQVNPWQRLRTRCQVALRRAEGLLGINGRNLDHVFPANPRRHRHLVDDKIEAKALLSAAGVAVPRTLFSLETLLQFQSVRPIWDSLEECAIKPACGARGEGILVLAGRRPRGFITVSGRVLTEGEVIGHLARILHGGYSAPGGDRVLVEERILPHAFLGEFYPRGLPDFRIIVQEGKPVLAMLRLPTARSKGTANLHQGGVGVGIDITSGRTMRAAQGSRLLERHPDSGRALVGASIPFWESLRELAVRAAAQVPLGYLGVDLVLDSEGRALVLEMNARPGLQIQAVCGVGLREVLGRTDGKPDAGDCK